MSYYFSFDVESLGLWGTGFAYGYVIVDSNGQELKSGYAACPLLDPSVHGSSKDIKWVQENCLPGLPTDHGSSEIRFILTAVPQVIKYATHFDAYEVRRSFNAEWKIANEQFPGIRMVCDCPFPVETNFLAEVARDIPEFKKYQPYPLIDVASVLDAIGQDPLGTYTRLKDELPVHNPVADAKQSARLFLEARGKTYL